MKIGWHTDAFNSACWSPDTCLAWVRRNRMYRIEGERQGGPMIEQSLARRRRPWDELRIPHE